MGALIEGHRQALIMHLENLPGQSFQNSRAIVRLAGHIADKKLDDEISKHLALETDALANLLLALEEINN